MNFLRLLCHREQLGFLSNGDTQVEGARTFNCVITFFNSDNEQYAFVTRESRWFALVLSLTDHSKLSLFIRIVKKPVSREQ